MRPDLAGIAVDPAFQLLGTPAELIPPGGTTGTAVLAIDARPDRRLEGAGFSVNAMAGRFEVRVAEIAGALAAAGTEKPKGWRLVVQTTPPTTWQIDHATIEDPARLKWTLTGAQIP